MKIENLKAGMIISNYKELCSLLDIKVTNGKSKVLQLKEIERFVRFHKSGNKFIIDEVFDMEKEKIDKRKDKSKISNNSMYSKDIQALIIDLLAQSKGNQIFLPTNALLRKLDMINDNYSTARKYIPKLSEIVDVPESYCYDFYNNINIRLRDKLETALRGLRNKALATWSSCITICVREIETEYNDLGQIKIDSNGRVKMKVIKTHRKADIFESELILEVERTILKEMGLTSNQDAYLKNKWNLFKDKVNEVLLERANILYYYNSYEVIYHHPHILEAAEEQHKDDINNDVVKINKLKLADRKQIKSNLNKNMCLFVNKTAKTFQARAKKKIVLNKNELLHINDDYLKNTNKLCNVLIDTSAKDIRKELVQDLKHKQLSFIKDEEEYLPF